MVTMSKQIRFRPRESDQEILESIKEVSGLDYSSTLRLALRLLAYRMKSAGMPIQGVAREPIIPKPK